IARFHSLATTASGEYKDARSSWTIFGSGYDQYLYSPRPKPWRAITVVLRKISFLSYMTASVRHSSRVRIALMMVHPKLSKSFVKTAQSREAIRSEIESAFRVMLHSFQFLLRTTVGHHLWHRGKRWGSE